VNLPKHTVLTKASRRPGGGRVGIDPHLEKLAILPPEPLLFLNALAHPGATSVGTAAYDRGSEILEEFFHQELPQFLVTDLRPTGRKIIECCLSRFAS
jgi:hypothetical protein